ncbi:MAG TPA: FAD-binding oxidoreductase [Gaiellaceae bacterium]|nr:FAD-binding oxidoreductase [Gaiellaceae bacterium]
MITSPLSTLEADFAGELILPGDPRYHASRAVFNAMIDRHPALIARCASTADVVSAVRFAAETGLPVAVRGGGHSVAGHGVCDGGIVIDLAGLKSIEVDAAGKSARAGGGVLWGELDAATQAHGLHTPGGRVTSTGIGGFTTGGGYGWTSSKHGLACDNLLSAEVVLADGTVVRASEDRHADLFWGIRGGGGNFGVVTEFEFRLHELGPLVLAGLALWPLERAPEVMRAWRDYADAAPDEVSTACVVVTAPPESFVPDHLEGRPALGIAVLYVGDPADGMEAVRPLKDLRPDLDHIGEMPYTAFQAALDATAPPGWRSYWRGEYLRSLSDGAIDTFLEHGATLVEEAPPLSQGVVFRIGQRINAVPHDATAFSQRDASYLFHPIAVWKDADDDERMLAAGRAYAEEMRRFADGSPYLNFTPEADRVRDAYTPDTYARLVGLKDAYDPDNLFRLNQNIAPSDPSGRAALPRLDVRSPAA